MLSVLLIFTNYRYEKRFIKDKSEFTERNKEYEIEVFTEDLINNLPEPLKNTFVFVDTSIRLFL